MENVALFYIEFYYFESIIVFCLTRLVSTCLIFLKNKLTSYFAVKKRLVSMDVAVLVLFNVHKQLLMRPITVPLLPLWRLGFNSKAADINFNILIIIFRQ